VGLIPTETYIFALLFFPLLSPSQPFPFSLSIPPQSLGVRIPHLIQGLWERCKLPQRKSKQWHSQYGPGPFSNRANKSFLLLNATFILASR